MSQMVTRSIPTEWSCLRVHYEGRYVLFIACLFLCRWNKRKKMFRSDPFDRIPNYCLNHGPALQFPVPVCDNKHGSRIGFISPILTNKLMFCRIPPNIILPRHVHLCKACNSLLSTWARWAVSCTIVLSTIVCVFWWILPGNTRKSFNNIKCKFYKGIWSQGAAGFPHRNYQKVVRS